MSGVESNDQAAIDELTREMDETVREKEFWYLTAKACVAFIVENLGMDAAGTMVEAVHARAIVNFNPSALLTEALADTAARDLIEDWRAMSKAAR